MRFERICSIRSPQSSPRFTNTEIMQLGIIMYWNVAIVMTMTRCTVMIDHDAIKDLSCFITRNDLTPHLGRDTQSFAAYHTLDEPQVKIKFFQALSSAKERRCWWVSERTNIPYSTMSNGIAVYSNLSPYAIWSTFAVQSVLASSCVQHHTVTARCSRLSYTNFFPHVFVTQLWPCHNRWQTPHQQISV